VATSKPKHQVHPAVGEAAPREHELTLWSPYAAARPGVGAAARVRGQPGHRPTRNAVMVNERSAAARSARDRLARICTSAGRVDQREPGQVAPRIGQLLEN